MSNHDKHKPLSPEELFKLLDNTSNSANDFDELDDFEKDALEGFSAHSNSQKAKALTDELNVAISEKVNDANKSGSKNKIVWFSAAASIVLIITLSVFFFNQTKENSATNIALNEAKEEKVLEAHQTETTPTLETISQSVISNNANAVVDLDQAPAKPFENEVNKQEAGKTIAGAGVTNEETIGFSENKPVMAPNFVIAKDEAKNRREADDNGQQKLSEGLVDKMDAKKKEENTISQEQESSEVAANQNGNTTIISKKTAKEEMGYYKTDADITVVENRSLEKEKTILTTSSSSSAKSKKTGDSFDKANSAPVVASGASSNVKSTAYYTGNELAIKDYVLEYFKEKAILNQVVGKFKILGTVDDKGVFKVVDVIQITKNNCNCVDDIKHALNSMKKWVVAIEDGKKVSDNVEFVLTF